MESEVRMTGMNHLIQHFRKEEQPFIEQVIGWQREVEDRYALKLTDFLDPRQRFIVESIIGRSEDLTFFHEGLFPNAERKRMLICPSYYELAVEDFQIVVLTIKYPAKFVQLKHPDVLGALLSIGLQRSKFGDIRIDEQQIQFAVAKEVEDFVCAQLKSIGKVKVHLEKLTKNQTLMDEAEEWVEETHTLSSLRLDALLSKVLNISRQKAQMLITGSKVRVNWTDRESVSFELHEGDIISIRTFGRIKLCMIEGRTKKDKIRVQIGRLQKK